MKNKKEESNTKLTKVTKYHRRKKLRGIIAGLTVATVCAGVAVPVSVYAYRNRQYEIVVQSQIQGFDSYKFEVKNGTKISDVRKQINVLEGHNLVGIFKDEALTQPFNDTDVISGQTTIYVKYEKQKYSINFNLSGAFSVIHNEQDLSNIEWGSSFDFKIALNEGYTQSDISVSVSGKTLEPDSMGTYRIDFVDKDLNIEVSDIALNTYIIGTIPSQVSIINEAGDLLYENSVVQHGENLIFVYFETTGYNMTKFKVNGQDIAQGTTISVDSDINIEYMEELKTFTLGTIPSQVVVKNENNEDLTSNSTIKYGDILHIFYFESSSCVKTEFKLNGEDIENGQEWFVFGDVNITYAEKEITYLSYEPSSTGTEIVITSIDLKDGQTTVEIPRTINGKPVTSIADGAFVNNATEIETLIIPSSVKTIGNVSNIQVDLNQWTVSGTGLPNLKSLTIEEGVEGISDFAFALSSSLVEAYLPSSIENMGVGVFGLCTSLEKVVLPSNMTTIPMLMFAYCQNLKEVVIPNGVETIEYGAFMLCSNLESVEIPDSVTTINGYAFSNCNSLTEIELPEGITLIDNAVFKACSNLESVVIPNSVKYISDGAFEYCYKLKSITLPLGILEVWNTAFSDCHNLIELVIPESLPESSLGNNVVLNNYNLAKIVIKSPAIYRQATSITETTFQHAGGILQYAKEIWVPKAVVDDANNVNTFLNSSAYVKLEEGEYYIYVPSEYADGCTKLISYNDVRYIGTEANPYKVALYCEDIDSEAIEIQEGCQTLTDYAFYNRSSLVSIKIPSSVTLIEGASCVTACVHLYQVTIDSVEIYTGLNNNSNLRKLITGANEIKVLKSIVDDESNVNRYLNSEQFVKIADGEYYVYLPLVTEGCTNLTTKDGVRYAGTEENPYKVALYYVDFSLEECDIQEGCEIIAYRAFVFANTTRINIPNSLKIIDIAALGGCVALEEIYIPSSIEEIRYDAFLDANIKKIVIHSVSIYNEDSHNIGGLFTVAKEVYILKSIVDNPNNSNDYLNSSAYTRTEEGEYYIYTKN